MNEWVELGQNKDGTHNICCGVCGVGKFKSRGHARSYYTKHKFKYCPNCGVKITDRKTENSSEKPNNSTISKMEQVDEPQYDAEDQFCIEHNCPHFYQFGGCMNQGDCPYDEDEPQTEIKVEPNWVGATYGRFETEPTGYNLSPVEDEPQTERSEK